MKIQVDGKDLFELKEWQKNVIKNDIPEEIFEADMKRRLQYVLEHKFEQSFKRLEAQWIPVLRDDPAVQHIPADKEAFVQLIMSHKDYKNRSARDAEI